MTERIVVPTTVISIYNDQEDNNSVEVGGVSGAPAAAGDDVAETADDRQPVAANTTSVTNKYPEYDEVPAPRPADLQLFRVGTQQQQQLLEPAASSTYSASPALSGIKAFTLRDFFTTCIEAGKKKSSRYGVLTKILDLHRVMQAEN